MIAGMSAPTRLRAAGLVATVLLAISAYLAGALPGGDPAPNLRATGSASALFWLGLAVWFAGSVLLCATWWRGRGLTTRQVLVTGVLWSVPLLLAPPLASRDVYAYACQGASVSAGLDPYAVGAAEAGCPWLAAVPAIWQHSTAPYGPLAIEVSGAAARLAGDHLWVAVLGMRLVALAGLAMIGFFGIRLARACGVDPATALWAGLVTPLVLVHAVSGAHNDALVAGLIIAALALTLPDLERLRPFGQPDLGSLQPSRQPDLQPQPDLVQFPSSGRRKLHKIWAGIAFAGVCVAGAVAVKVTAIVALPFVLILAGRRWWAALASAVITFAALTLVTGLGFGWLTALTGTQELTQWTSVPTGIGMAFGYLLRAIGHPEAEPAAIAVARMAGVLTLAVIGLVAVKRAWRTDTRTVVAACGWVMAAAALLGPVFYPWYAMAPLAVLACAGTAFAKVRAIVTVALIFLVLPQGLGLAALTKGPGAVGVLIAVVWLSWRAQRGGPRARA